MTDNDNAALVITRLTREADDPTSLEPGCIYAFMTEAGPRVIDLLTDEKYLDEPRRKRGSVTVTDVASFAQYYAKHADEGSEVFADRDDLCVRAVLDAHAAGAPRWRDHHLVLQLEHTPEWTAWSENDRNMTGQAEFAEFIEDHIADIAADGPCTGSDLLEMAQQFHAHSSIKFSAGSRLADGQTQFEYIETIEAKAGERGQITIPGAFELGIRVFDDLEPYRVKARFRYRITDGKLTLGYHLNDPERVVRDATGLVVAKAEAACGVKIMLGRP